MQLFHSNINYIYNQCIYVIVPVFAQVYFARSCFIRTFLQIFRKSQFWEKQRFVKMK